MMNIREKFCNRVTRAVHMPKLCYLNQFAVTNTVGHRYMADEAYRGFPDTTKYGVSA